jgi:thiamine pyrophosphate-dependent acetolactate synthase large subunit-like protein
MARNAADVMWEMLEKAGVKRCYGIVGDALNPVIDALHRNGKIEFVDVRHEEYGLRGSRRCLFHRRAGAGVRHRGPGSHTAVQRADGREKGRRADHCDCGRCGNESLAPTGG